MRKLVIFFTFISVVLQFDPIAYGQEIIWQKKIDKFSETSGWFSPTFSPTGKLVLASTMGKKSTLIALERESGQIEVLIDNEVTGYRPVWSSDEKEIYYRKEEKGVNVIGTIIKAMKIKEEVIRTKENLSSPCPSAKGFLAFVEDKQLLLWTGGRSISPTQVGAFEVGRPFRFTVSPRNNNLVVIEGEGGISLLERNNGSVKPIFINPSNGGAIWSRFSPEGDKISFYCNEGAIGHIYVFNVENNSIKDLGRGGMPLWYNNDTIITATLNLRGEKISGCEFFLIDSDGKSRGILASFNDVAVGEFDITSDGKYIAARDEFTGNMLLGEIR